MDNLEVVVGTYENLLIGYKIASNHVNEPVLETSFTDDSHRGALRCVAVSRTGMLASSSTDDSIRLHSLKKRREIGSLFEHSGTVNSIVFYDNKHMFSASEDGTICLWKTKTWELMRALKGHKSHVMAVAVHPSGKLGLSVGSDRSFLTWDLLTGKRAFQRKLQDVAQNIFFTPSGDQYILVFNKKIEICSLQDTKVVRQILTEWRINTVSHVKENIFAVGGDDRQILLYDVLDGTQVMCLDAAKTPKDDFCSRVRCICIIDQDKHKLLFAATASGDIKAFRLDLNKNKAEEVFFGETRVRVTSMGVYSSSSSTTEAGRPDIVRSKTSLTTKVSADESDDDASQGSDESEEPPPSPPNPKKRKMEQDSTKLAKKMKKKKMLQEAASFAENGEPVKSKEKKDATKTPVELNQKKKMKAKKKNK